MIVAKTLQSFVIRAHGANFGDATGAAIAEALSGNVTLWTCNVSPCSEGCNDTYAKIAERNQEW